jgi:hypothetical protein
MRVMDMEKQMGLYTGAYKDNGDWRSKEYHILLMPTLQFLALYNVASIN